MPGPLPNPERRRTNAPTIPTTLLPAHGFAGKVPPVPGWIRLGVTGRAFWRWAWRTPQAAAWGVRAGAEVTVARRAVLEDLLADAPSKAEVVSLTRQALALDRELALTPKAMADQRLKIVDEDANVGAVPVAVEPEVPAAGGNVSSIDGRRKRLTS